MPVFLYKAVAESGQVETGQMEGTDRDAVIAQLQQTGYLPIRADLAQGGRFNLNFSLRRFGSRAARRREVAGFTFGLAALLRAGLPLDRALALLNEMSEDDGETAFVSDIAEQVRGGKPLSEALDAQRGLFSRLYINLVRAGEASGALDEALARLAEYLEQSRELKESVVSAIIYPSILLVVAGLSVIILLTFVVPQFTGLFEEMGRDLPFATRVVITAGEALRDFWWLFLLTGVVIIWVSRVLLSRPNTRYRWDAWLLRWPLVGELVRKFDVARFSRTLGTLMGSGVPLLAALSISRETLSNRVLAKGLDAAVDSLRAGRGLVEPLLGAAQFPKLALQLIQVGEESGQLEEMLLRTADIYDKEVKLTVQRLLSLLEPILIVSLGLIIAGIVMSIMVAILGINELGF